MNSALHSLTAAWPWTTIDVLNHLWQSTAVGLVVLAALALGRGLSARTRRTLAWMALVKFALPTGVLVHVLGQWGTTPDRWVASSVLTSPMVLPAFVATAPTAETPDRVSAGLVLALVWLAGFAGLFVSWLVRGRILRRQIFAEVQPVPRELEPRIAAVAGRVGLAEEPRCLAVGHERAPGVLGVVAPVVILPRGLEATLTPAELDAVLIHEFVHVQRRDNLWSAAQAFFVSLFWFHPIVWLLNRRLALETEQSCDERVLEITGDPDTYAGGIVKAVQHALGLAQPGLIGATTPPIITRIKNILAHGARRDRPLVRGAALAGGVAVIALSGYAGSFAVPARTRVASTASPQATADTPTTTVATLAPVATQAPAAESTIAVDFTDEDTRRVLRNVAERFQLDVTFPTELKGKTTVKLKNATWRQIYQAVLTPIDYTFITVGSLIKIVPATGSVGAGGIADEGVTLSPAEALPFLVAQTDRLKQRAEALQAQAATSKATQPGAASERMEAEAVAAAAEYAVVDARRQATEIYATGTGDAAQLAELAAKREAEVLQQHVARAEARRVKPVAMASLPALAAQSRLTDQADRLKREAEALRSEVEALGAAKANSLDAPADPEAAAKAANLAAIDARRQAVELAALATGDAARLAEVEEKRKADAQLQRAHAAEDRARLQVMMATRASNEERIAANPKLPAPEAAQSTPKAPVGSALAEMLVDASQSAADEYRARGIKVYEPNQLDYMPVPAYQARPQYPFALRRANTPGEAIVDFIVDESGNVMGAYSVKYTHVEFAEAATAAVAKWKFKAGRKGGRNVPTHMQVPIVFSLNGQ